MIILGPTDILRVTAANGGAVDVVCSYVDTTDTAYTPGAQRTTIAGTSPVTVLVSPSALATRALKHATLVARGGANALTLEVFDGATAYRIPSPSSLGADETLEYVDTIGWHVLDSRVRPRTADGLDGNDGATGAQGAAGPQGVAGPPGLDGDDGDQGLPGPEGPRGSTGPQGVAGDTGATGPQGVAGPPGLDGDDGDQGLPGPAGAQGSTGPQGTSGNDGATGATGPQGVAGPPGIDGDDGDPGLPGPIGPQGAAGNDGAAGAAGPQGVAGPPGLDGDDGDPGLPGPAGPQGSPGADGAAGSVGPQGAAQLGFDGVDGVDGLQGAGLSDGDKGDVSVANSGAALTINNNAVTAAKLAQAAARTVLGNLTLATANVANNTMQTLRETCTGGVLSQTTAQLQTASTTNVTAGPYTIPANTLEDGSHYCVDVLAFAGRGATVTATNVIVELLINAVVIRTLTIAINVAANSNGVIRIEGRVTVRTTGAGGTALVTLHALSQNVTATTVAINVDPAASGTAVSATTVDTTASRTIEVRARLSAATATCYVQMLHSNTTKVR